MENEPPVSDLNQLQQWVARWVQSPRKLPGTEPVTDEAALHLTGNDRLLPVEQLDIYRQQFWLRHTSALVDDFPGLGGILGQTEWERLVEGYLAAHPPRGWTLRELGARMPEYVEEAPDLPHRDLCRDMAHLEWDFIELFDAADAKPLEASRLAELPPGSIERGRIVLHPALRLRPVDYPVAALRQSLIAYAEDRSDEPPPLPEPEAATLVLYRGQDRRLYHRPVPREAFELLKALQDGSSLVAACEHVLQLLPDRAEALQKNVGGWFQRWSSRGWIVDVRPGGPEEA